ncbi:HupE/UreJ family protein [Actinoplanes awajinensis]|uniref:Aromatic ring-opening dioxygenase LigA n=1 Tax=Actinoplanes awajinensis subsp. mycoplanecinus TaxID=135947 RepID=A0A101JT97_9ACTN|nr:HupE/UreJ family protein [Actinoplanes awajinensis]KUL32612.1 aromatic ring-opening dioxygenase LigA [Actinoplanes awajinensis subsp. mycoplanecinus]
MLRRSLTVAALGVAATATVLLSAAPALAHGFSSTVYVDVTAGDAGRVRTAVELEYDLFIVSAADYESDDPLFRAGTDAFEAEDTVAMGAALNAHRESAVRYVTERFGISSDGTCTGAPSGDFTMGAREGVPYATMLLDWTCPPGGDAHEVRSALFPDTETYVKGVKTIVTYALDGRTGSAALDASAPTFSTGQSWQHRFGEFFLLGAEHLLTGIDHILFLLALIAGSRRLREIVLAATAFTVAHSVTFMLAALGLVDVPARVVEPVIALSIAVVAGWNLIAAYFDKPDNNGRLGVVFLFGLVHGLGFAGALGIDEAFSWTLLWSLLVFNVGIETVQLSVIALAFPLLIVLRRRSPRAGRWATGIVSAGVSVMGLIWFGQRLLEG